MTDKEREKRRKYRTKSEGGMANRKRRNILYRQSEEGKIASRSCANRCRANLKVEVINHYGGKCACCGETELVFLCIDHINGGGKKHLKEIHQDVYTWLRKNNYPKDFRVLCWNCNSAMSILGSCPHQNKKEVC